LRCYAVLAPVSRSYPPLEGRLVTCYSPGRHCTQGLLPFLVRLACVRHAASVDSEPGSNSRLKPDACRRVVGRLPSPHIQISLQKPFWSTARDGATVQPPLNPPKRVREVHGGLSCEIVRAYARILSLTTGTFNRVVKDRIAVRRSGANSVQANPHKCESDCPRNLTNIQCAGKSCQPIHPTGFPDVFHIGKSQFGTSCGNRYGRASFEVDAFLLDPRVARLASCPSRTCIGEGNLGAQCLSSTRNRMVFRFGWA
jgi:hypothetical protein